MYAKLTCVIVNTANVITATNQVNPIESSNTTFLFNLFGFFFGSLAFVTKSFSVIPNKSAIILE